MKKKTSPGQLDLLAVGAPPPRRAAHASLLAELRQFSEFGQPSVEHELATRLPDGTTIKTPLIINEFWTSRQRQAHAIHDVSYRACFKPQLPRFFIERLTQPGERVYDPFMGRGTTLVEAALLDRSPAGCDINPLSLVLTRPRLNPPSQEAVGKRLKEIPLSTPDDLPEDLLAFYHPETLAAVSSLKRYLRTRRESGAYDAVDDWIALVSLNRLTGHSPGFFSVYTMPPNQAVSAVSQHKINERRNQTPPRRDVVKIILKKSAQLLSECDESVRATLARRGPGALLLTAPASDTPALESGSVSLVVTSPPFLNVIDYATDNWLRCWFQGIDTQSVRLTVPRKLDAWGAAMNAVFVELARVLKPGGHAAFEVGEVKGGTIKLEETVVPCGVQAGLKPVLVLVNAQEFTKTANCWGVDNNAKGTNTNRVVVFQKTSAR